MITVYTFFFLLTKIQSECVCVKERETTYLNPEYSQTSYALLKKKP